MIRITFKKPQKVSIPQGWDEPFKVIELKEIESKRITCSHKTRGYPVLWCGEFSLSADMLGNVKSIIEIT